MIKLKSSKMTKAIERARSIRPRVRVLSVADRTYSVTGSKGDIYTVRFSVARGLKLAQCDCIAGQREQLCYHVAAASQVNIMVQSMRQNAASSPAPAKPADERGTLIADIKRTWPKTWPPLYTELLARFGKSNLEMLDTDMLRRVRLAIAL